MFFDDFSELGFEQALAMRSVGSAFLGALPAHRRAPRGHATASGARVQLHCRGRYVDSTSWGSGARHFGSLGLVPASPSCRPCHRCGPMPEKAGSGHPPPRTPIFLVWREVDRDGGRTAALAIRGARPVRMLPNYGSVGMSLRTKLIVVAFETDQ